MTHDWDLVERLLLEVRQSAHENFAPRALDRKSVV